MHEEPHTEHRKLPIGIQTFSTLRNEACYYVDKTSLIQDLVKQGRYYFLSRPRRFGKSLLVDTLKELFEGNEPLFRGLSIHDHWDWSTRHPVVRISFGVNYRELGDLQRNIMSQLTRIERNAGIEQSANNSGPDRLQDLLDRLHRTTGQQVVVLVDEYDKPILDVIDQPKMAAINRDYLRGFYGAIKDSANDVRFVFVAGVSMFTKMTLFSELNNLKDISLSPRYASICGYTDDDLDTVFAPELVGLDRNEIRRWYNGYHWLGEDSLYNPFDVLLLFDERTFDSYWFATGSPSFLIKALMKKGISLSELERRSVDSSQVSRFDVKNIDIDALFFQSGYLTIKERVREGNQTFYILDYPNLEVRLSLNRDLLGYLGQSSKKVTDLGKKLSRSMAINDFAGFADLLRSFFAGITYQWQPANGPARYEAWYAGMLYSCFNVIGLTLQVEESSSHGRSDMVIFHKGQIFVLEFKLVEDRTKATEALDSAITQIREIGYAEKYRSRNEPIHLVGLVFGRKERNLLEVRSEKI